MATTEEPPMKVAISGSSGLIGSALAEHLRARGDTVARMVRSPDDLADGDILWSVADQRLDPADLVGIDAVVHLASEPIGTGSWKDAHRTSRVEGTRLLAEAMADLAGGPQALVSASAVGYYGSRGDEVLTEDATAGDDFLARLCRDWEAAAQPARDAGLRVANFRTGVVLAEGGPLIDKVKVPFKLGVGGRVGDGRQFVPWISLDDQSRALAHLLDHDLEGPFNLAGPEPVRNRRMTKALGAAWRRPTILPVPVAAVRLLYGEIGRDLATASQRAIPQRLLESGFTFVHDTIEAAAHDALVRP